MDEILARAGIFQGVEPTAVSALTKQLQPVDFPCGHTVFAEGEPGDRLDNVIRANVRKCVATIQGLDPILSDFVRNHGLKVAGGVYDLRTGKVDVFA